MYRGEEGVIQIMQADNSVAQRRMSGGQQESRKTVYQTERTRMREKEGEEKIGITLLRINRHLHQSP